MQVICIDELYRQKEYAKPSINCFVFASYSLSLLRFPSRDIVCWFFAGFEIDKIDKIGKIFKIAEVVTGGNCKVLLFWGDRISSIECLDRILWTIS